jgi:hypothetical protein
MLHVRAKAGRRRDDHQETQLAASFPRQRRPVAEIRKASDEMNPIETIDTTQVEIGHTGAFPSGRLSELQQAIVALVRERDTVSFVEAEQLCKQLGVDHRGNMALMLGDPEANVVLWAGMSDAFFLSIRSLIERRQIFVWPSMSLVYIIDGKLLDLPTVRAKRPKKRYSRPTWLPTVLRCIPYRKQA